MVGADPVLMLTGPIAATEKVLDRSGVHIDEIGAFEVNEAFSPVPLAWLAELGVKPELLNPVGGAIALGHPLGATGAGLADAAGAPHARPRPPLRPGQTVCEGGGTANATLLELVQ